MKSMIQKTRLLPWIGSLILCFVMALGLHVNDGFGQTTVTYTMQTVYNAAKHIDGTADAIDNGPAEIKMYANSTGNKEVVVWRDFKTAGDGTGSARSLQVGDKFTITVSATSAFGGIGFSLNDGGTQGTSYANRISGSRLFVQEEGTGASWEVNRDGGYTTLDYNVSSTRRDYTFEVTITSQTTANVQLFDGGDPGKRAFNLTMNGTAGANIDAFSMWLKDDWNGSSSADIYWKQGTYVVNTGVVQLGYYLTSGSFTPGLITDGLAANSTSTTSSNDVYVGGDDGTNIIFAQSNTYTGSTTINNIATLTLGASGVIPDASNVILDGGTLQTGSTTGFSETAGVLSLTENSTIDFGTGSHTLTFSASSGEAWTADKTLTITDWVSGTTTLKFGTDNTALTKDQLSRFRFDDYGPGAVITSTGEIIPATGSITGSEGWRLLASPVSNSSFDDLIGGLWTQCFTGADAPVGECPNGADDSNVRTLNSSGSYVSISDQSTTIDPGVGFAVYVYQDDDYTDSGATGSFPKTISVSGKESTSDVSPTTFDTDEVYTLLGNPFISTIDADDLTRSGLSTVVYVYDHSYTSGFSGDDETNSGGAGGGWRTWNGSAGGLTDGLIAPFQGFLVVNNASTSSITIPTSAKTSSSSSLKNEDVLPPMMHLAARINNSQVSDVWFSFTETGSLEENSYDANALYALDYTPYLMFHTVSNGRALDIKNLPLDLDGEFSLPLNINGWKPVDDENVQAYEPMGGSVEIIWPTMRNIPDEWEVSLTDHEAGTSVDLTDPSVERYEFELVVDAKSSERLPYRLAIQEAKVPEKLNSRFTLDINAVPTSIDPADELPVSVVLAQNYPNPFNPATSIRFELPEAQSVMLDVFDMSGRQIATLASGVHQAGSHEVKFDASDLSSGVYLYRLQTASGTLTRKFTLLK